MFGQDLFTTNTNLKQVQFKKKKKSFKGAKELICQWGKKNTCFLKLNDFAILKTFFTLLFFAILFLLFKYSCIIITIFITKKCHFNSFKVNEFMIFNDIFKIYSDETQGFIRQHGFPTKRLNREFYQF